MKTFSVYMTRRAVLDKLPGYVQFETNTYCDQKCIFCVHDEIPKRKMDIETIKKIIDETITSAHTCCPFWFQDPLLEPRLREILRYIKKTNARCKTTIYSTMSHARKETMKEIMEDATLDELYVSMYSQRTQPGMNIDNAAKNIDDILQLKDDLISRSPTIIMMMITDIHTDEEIINWRRKWEWKAKMMIVPFDTLGGKKKLENRTRGPNTDKSNRKPCQALWNTLNINADGDIMPCCVAFEKEYSFGNVHDDGILNILNGTKAIEMREAHIDGKFDEYDICKDCNKWEWSQ